METTDDEDTERVDGRGAGVPGAPSALAGAEVDARVSGVGYLKFDCNAELTENPTDFGHQTKAAQLTN
jgi:hypothetical protein